MKKALWLVLTTCLTMSAWAHDDATLDSMQSPNGGQMRMAGPYHYELVINDKKLSVYLSDHAGKNVSSTGVTGYALLLNKQGKTKVELKPSTDNVIVGEGNFTLTPDLKAVVSLTFPNKETWQAKFTPADKKSHHHH